MRARVLGTAVLAAALLVGCSGDDGQGQPSPSDGPSAHERAPDDGNGGTADDGGDDGAAQEQAEPGDEGQGDGEDGESGSTDDRSDEAPSGSDDVAESDMAERERHLARSATLDVRVSDVDDAAADARRIASRVDGYTGAERSTGDAATLTLTVPAEDLESTLDELADLGEPQARQITSEDVTDSVVDTDSRIESQRASVRRARALFDEAESISDITSVERELSQRESELESLLARQKALAGKVAMAPIDLQLRTQDAPPPDDDDRAGFVGGLAGGWSAFTTMLGGAAHGVGAAAPFAVAVGVPLGFVGLLWRRRRSGRVTSPEPEPTDAG